jgi:uncharacterized protein (TIGR00288 family)
MQPPRQRIAILVDAENVSSKHWQSIRKTAESYGTINCCRLFGDFTNGRQAKWLKLAQDEALQPVMQFSGNNACDMAIVIAAMDLLHAGKTEGICVVSSDRDFLPLVQRLKTAGMRVYGFGEAKASAALRKSCTAFVVLGDLKIAGAPAAKAA